MDHNSGAKKLAKLRVQAERRASTLGIPRSVWKPVVDLFFHWLSHSGEEWTVKRFKSLTSDFTQWLATGNRLPVPWVKRSSSKNSIYGGAIGLLERWCKTPDQKLRSLNLLKIYTLLVSPNVTKSQLDKFVSAVHCAETDWSYNLPSYPEVSSRKNLFWEFGKTIQKVFHKTELPKILGSSGSSSKRGPTPTGSLPEPSSFVESVRFLGDFEDGFHIYAKYKEIFDPVLGPDLKFRICSDFGLGKREHGFHVGRIGLIQEPGYKLRAVANPGRVFQFALHKLGNALYRGLEKLPWDCTFEQSKAHPFIQSHLRNGGTVFCVDLRNATDFFPFALQRNLMLETLPDSDKEFLSHVNLFSEISRSPWKLGDGFISWSTGQPLGLYPSFASFAATHGFLLFHLNGQVWNNSFFVLGDDVVILDYHLFTKYVETLSDLGCPTSPEKSLISQECAEFAGNMIFADRIVPLIKWRDISDDNFVEIAKYLGPKSLSIFQPRQRKVLEKIMSYPTIGCGWNPKGIPLTDRAAEEAVLMNLSSDTVPEPQASRVPEVWRDVMSSSYYSGLKPLFGTGSNSYSYIDFEDDLDQKSRELVRNYLGVQFSDIHSVVVANAVMVSKVFGLPSRERGMHHGRRTNLELLESKLLQVSNST